MKAQSKTRKGASAKRGNPKNTPRYFWREFVGWWHRTWWHKAVVLIAMAVVLIITSMYGIAQWYIYSNRQQPVRLGATFIAGYADYLGVDPHETLYATIHDLGVQHLRLVSYWDEIEKQPGTYDFRNLDWQMQMAQDTHVPVSLAIGLRQPRWPECHMPEWALGETKSVWQPQLQQFISAVVNRYKGNPTLESYQLENEFFLTAFGECRDFDRNRLVAEAAMVKQLDPNHELIISRSNNAVGLPLGKPTPDMFGVSIYKRVWDKTVTHRYYEYPFPAWFYAFLAGAGKIATGKDMIVHELQTEAWLPEGYDIKNAPLSELSKTMNDNRLWHRIEYGKGTGMKTVDMWGVEWWYQMKQLRGQPGLWQTAKDEINSTKATNSLRASGVNF
jgi:hypothetical protein